MLSANTIKTRVSVRTFNTKTIPQAVLDQIKTYIEQIENPFDVPVQFKILSAKQHNLSSPVIIGADTYVAAKCPKAPNAELAFGYAFEKFVLYATSLGIGTVWLAATMNRAEFESAIELNENEIMLAVSPIGFAADKRSMRETLMRKSMKSDVRLPFESLFFHSNFQSSLTESSSAQWLFPLQMLRLSPSATNKQPWRVIVDGNKAHFYEEKTKGYAKEGGADIQKVDLGIAICHFEITAIEQGLRGQLTQSNPGIVPPNDNIEYIATYELED